MSKTLDVDDLHCPGCEAHQLQNCNCSPVQIAYGEKLRYIRKQQALSMKPSKDFQSFLSRKRAEHQSIVDAEIQSKKESSYLYKFKQFISSESFSDEFRIQFVYSVLIIGGALLVWWA